jgi:hypothetical protein
MPEDPSNRDREIRLHSGGNSSSFLMDKPERLPDFVSPTEHYEKLSDHDGFALRQG